jgi:NTP pyrophosphatase (non-canonical NTP hydrolase)|tara:strand:+ start:691 stop:924 length:234 start_codon:yes stop_codon:yes gene_type:complete
MAYKMTKDKITLKLVEELNELATVLLQNYNKPMKEHTIEIQDEIADVKLWLNIVEKRYDKEYIDKRIESKTKKYKLW